MKEGGTSYTMLTVSRSTRANTPDSILSHHLTLSPHPPSLNTTSLLHSHPNLAASGSSTQSVITSAIEQDMGQTLKEVLSNAGQTGVEEQMDQVVEVAKVLAKGAVESG